MARPGDRPNNVGIAVGRGVLKGLGALFSIAEGFFSPPKPPTREQAKQAVRAEAEEDRQAGFRAHVAEIAQRQSTIVDHGRTQRREQDREAHGLRQAWRGFSRTATRRAPILAIGQSDSSPHEPLGPLLGALAEEAHREAAAGSAEIMREFSAAMREAQLHAPRHELSAILTALKVRRRAMLTLARRRAAMELQGRRRLLIQSKLGARSCARPRSLTIDVE